MIVDIQRDDDVFKPITLKIVIESKEELSNLKSLTGTPNGVAKAVDENIQEVNVDIIKDFLSKLRDVIIPD